MKRVSLMEIFLCILTMALTVTALVPVVAKIQRTPADAQCQANLKRWAEAMDLYVADNNGVYPTNRAISGGVIGNIAANIALSPDEIDPATGKPKRFVYGINWVEALYPYLWDRAEKTGIDWKTSFKCPSVSNVLYPTNTSYNQKITYTFNGSLIEQPKALLQKPDKLMVFREFSRVTCAILRPMNTNCIANNAMIPQYPFLSTSEYGIAGDMTTAAKLHGDGSYIVFADGHIKHFTLDYYPAYAKITSANNYDPLTQKWYNYVYSAPSTDQQVLLNKSIAITP